MACDLPTGAIAALTTLPRALDAAGPSPWRPAWRADEEGEDVRQSVRELTRIVNEVREGDAEDERRFDELARSAEPMPMRAARRPPPPCAFLSHQADDFGTDLSWVDFRLAVGKPHNDFCRLLPIGFDPQIKIGNDLVESLEEKRNRLRIEGSIVS
jgi:hypothetical protein